MEKPETSAAPTFDQELAAAKAELLKEPTADGSAETAAETSALSSPSGTDAATSSEESAAAASESTEKSPDDKSAAEEKPETTEKVDPAKMAQQAKDRLHLAAREERRLANDRKKFEAEMEARRPDLDLLQKIRSAPTMIEKVKLSIGADDDALAELFLELNDWHGTRGEKKQETTEQIADRRARQILKEEQDRQAEVDRQAAIAERTKREEVYVKTVQQHLEDHGDKFPLTYVAGVGPADILKTVKEVFEATGHVPSPEEILEEAEKLRRGRQDNLTKRRKPETKPEAKPESRAAENGAEKQTPSQTRRSDAPVSTPRPMSWEDELEAAKREAGVT